MENKEEKMRKLISGVIQEPKGDPLPPTLFQKLNSNPFFDSFIIGVIILNICLLATDNTSAPFDEQLTTRLNAYLFCDVIFII
jgi:hypothetical protein